MSNEYQWDDDFTEVQQDFMSNASLKSKSSIPPAKVGALQDFKRELAADMDKLDEDIDLYIDVLAKYNVAESEGTPEAADMKNLLVKVYGDVYFKDYQFLRHYSRSHKPEDLQELSAAIKKATKVRNKVSKSDGETLRDIKSAYKIYAPVTGTISEEDHTLLVTAYSKKLKDDLNALNNSLTVMQIKMGTSTRDAFRNHNQIIGDFNDKISPFISGFEFMDFYRDINSYDNTFYAHGQSQRKKNTYETFMSSSLAGIKEKTGDWERTHMIGQMLDVVMQLGAQKGMKIYAEEFKKKLLIELKIDFVSAHDHDLQKMDFLKEAKYKTLRNKTLACK